MPTLDQSVTGNTGSATSAPSTAAVYDYVSVNGLRGYASFSNNVNYRLLGYLDFPSTPNTNVSVSFFVTRPLGNAVGRVPLIAMLNVDIRRNEGTYSFKAELVKLNGDIANVLHLFYDSSKLYIYGKGFAGIYFSVIVQPISIRNHTGAPLIETWHPNINAANEASVSYTSLTFSEIEYAPKSHQSDTDAYGAATTAKYGHTKLTSDVANNSASEVLSVTPKAVYDYNVRSNKVGSYYSPTMASYTDGGVSKKAQLLFTYTSDAWARAYAIFTIAAGDGRSSGVYVLNLERNTSSAGEATLISFKSLSNMCTNQPNSNFGYTYDSSTYTYKIYSLVTQKSVRVLQHSGFVINESGSTPAISGTMEDLTVSWSVQSPRYVETGSKSNPVYVDNGGNVQPCNSYATSILSSSDDTTAATPKAVYEYGTNLLANVKYLAPAVMSLAANSKKIIATIDNSNDSIGNYSGHVFIVTARDDWAADTQYLVSIAPSEWNTYTPVCKAYILNSRNASDNTITLSICVMSGGKFHIAAIGTRAQTLTITKIGGRSSNCSLSIQDYPTSGIQAEQNLTISKLLTNDDLSTSISTDSTSDVKAATPKAVNDFVNGKEVIFKTVAVNVNKTYSDYESTYHRFSFFANLTDDLSEFRDYTIVAKYRLECNNNKSPSVSIQFEQLDSTGTIYPVDYFQYVENHTFNEKPSGWGSGIPASTICLSTIYSYADSPYTKFVNFGFRMLVDTADWGSGDELYCRMLFEIIGHKSI